MTEPRRERTYTWNDPREIARAIVGREHREWMTMMKEGALPHAPFASTLAFEIEEIGDGRVVFSMPLAEWMCNPTGVVHGGVSATLLDSVLTLSVLTRLPREKLCTTIDLNVHFVRPLFPSGARIRAEGSALHVGTTVATAEARLLDERDRLIAHATTSLAIIDAVAMTTQR
ncbi:MAG: PaaI family thioesterase [bacterium]|nr:PaaI family thioesterase [bacterium]